MEKAIDMLSWCVFMATEKAKTAKALGAMAIEGASALVAWCSASDARIAGLMVTAFATVFAYCITGLGA